MAGLGEVCGCDVSPLGHTRNTFCFIAYCVRASAHADDTHGLLNLPSAAFCDVDGVTCLEDLPVVTSVGGTGQQSL